MEHSNLDVVTPKRARIGILIDEMVRHKVLFKFLTKDLVLKKQVRAFLFNSQSQK